jgi:hypothetical protein
MFNVASNWPFYGLGCSYAGEMHPHSYGGISMGDLGNTQLYIRNNAVGVGASPYYFKLDVIDDSYPIFRVGTSAGTFGQIALGNTNHGIGRGINLSTATYGNDMVVHTAGSGSVVLCTSFAEQFRVNPSGNVGIGTSNPSYKLDVNGNTRLNNAVIGDLLGSYLFAGFKHSYQGSYSLLHDNSGVSYLNCATGASISFRENNADVAIIYWWKHGDRHCCTFNQVGCCWNYQCNNIHRRNDYHPFKLGWVRFKFSGQYFQQFDCSIKLLDNQ